MISHTTKNLFNMFIMVSDEFYGYYFHLCIYLENL